MPPTDPIFAHLSQVSGPQSIHVFRIQHSTQDARWVYVIGENHEADGGGDVHAIHKVVSDFAQKHPVHVWVETKDAMTLATSVALGSTYGNPIDMVCYELKFNTGLHPGVVVREADCRQKKPYDILELLYNKNNFINRYKNEFLGNREQYNLRWKSIKELEKHLLANLGNRSSAVRFLRALIYPNRTFPPWYVRACNNLQTGNESEEPNFDMKQTLGDLEKNHPEFFANILGYVEERWDALITRNETHSPLMKSMERRRKTAASSLAQFKTVSQRNELFEDYYATIFSVMLDVEFLQALVSDDNDVPLVYFVGNSHALAMASFMLRSLPQCDVAWSAYSPNVFSQPISLAKKALKKG